MIFLAWGLTSTLCRFWRRIRSEGFNAKEKNDILPEHNAGMYAVPQILTNSAADFLRIEKDLGAFGYRELNINLGCPSGTVVSKGRGAGFLASPGKTRSVFGRDLFKDRGEDFLKDQDRDGGTGGIFPAA